MSLTTVMTTLRAGADDITIRKAGSYVPPLKGLGLNKYGLPSAEALGYLLPSRFAGLDLSLSELFAKKCRSDLFTPLP